MTDLINILNRAGDGFCGFALAMLIQSGILIVLLYLIDLLIRRHVRAVFRYCIWMLIFVKLILPPTLCLPTGIGYWCSLGVWPANSQVSTETPVKATAQEADSIAAQYGLQHLPPAQEVLGQPVRTQGPAITDNVTYMPPILPSELESASVTTANPGIPITWRAVVFLVWLVGILVLSVLLFQRVLFVKSLLAQGDKANGRLDETLQQCCRQVGLRRNIEFRLSRKMLSPAVCGLFNPVILMPASLLENLSREKLRAVLIHELAHIKRGDLWVNFMQTILQIVYFYNPLLWFANAVVRGIREKAVDEMVLTKLGDEADSYSGTLIDIAEIAFSRPHFSLRLVGVVESKKALAGRIKHILSRPFPKSAKLGIVGLIAVIVTAAILLPMAKVKKSNFFIDTIEGYIRCDATHSELGRAILNMAHVYEFKHKNSRSRDFGNDESPIQYSTNTYTIPNNKKLTFNAVAEKGQQLRINIEVEPGAVYTTPDITIELARQLGLLSKTAKQMKIIETQNSEQRASNSDFIATLPNGVTVELVGVCENPSEGKQWWRPGGELLLKAPYEHSSTKAHPNKGQKAYEAALLCSGVSEDNGLSVKFHVDNSSSSSFGSVSQTKTSYTHSASFILPEKKEHANIRVQVAAGDWMEYDRRFPVRERRQMADGIVWFPAKEEDGQVVQHIVHSHTENNIRMVAVTKSGETVTACFSSVKESGDISDSTFKFDKLKLEDVSQFIFQTRPYEWITFKNVSLKPNFKTDVQVEGENIGSKLEFRVVLKQGKVTQNTDIDAILLKDLTDTLIAKGPDDEIWGNSELYSKYKWLEIADSTKDTDIVVRHNGKRYALLSNEPEFIMLANREWGLQRVYAEKDNRGKPAIKFEFDIKGGESFYELTSNNLMNRLAIIINGKIYSAPQINSAIRGQGVITGTFSEAEVNELVGMLSKGMPAVVPRIKGQQPGFDPVVEITISDCIAVRKNSLIDFDTGKLFSPPDDEYKMHDSDKGLEWIISNGIDAIGATRNTVRGLDCEGVIFVSAPNSSWDRFQARSLATSDLWKMGKPGRPAYMTGKGELPATYIFKTREGGIGILQITGFTDEPRGVNIRYKMVKKTDVQIEVEKPS